MYGFSPPQVQYAPPTMNVAPVSPQTNLQNPYGASPPTGAQQTQQSPMHPQMGMGMVGPQMNHTHALISRLRGQVL